MPIYNIYIFDRVGNTVYYHEWQRIRPSTAGTNSSGLQSATGATHIPLASTPQSHAERHSTKRQLDQQEDCKLMRGLLLTLKEFCARIAPAYPVHLGQDITYFNYQTSKYRLHFSETLTGLKIVLTTDRNCAPLREELQHIYSRLYVPLVVKNPLCEQPGVSTVFKERLDEYIQTLPAFVAGGRHQSAAAALAVLTG